MRKIRLLAFLTIGVLLLCLSGYAQERTITGVVTSSTDDAVLTGVTVTVKGTNRATQTDATGKFSITAEKGQTLQFTSVGFQTQDVVVGDENVIRIRLSAIANTLADVVVVGYGTQKRGNLTGAVSTVNVENTLGSRPITDVARGLQGAVPGLTITTPSGDLGTNPQIRLRGLSGSLNGSGAQPLILVDNVEMPDLRMINPDDIESITVLKDAASASIYGTRAAWGVLLITTKSGKKGADKSKISYTNNFSFGRPTKVPEIAPAAEGAEMAFKALQRTSPNLSVFGVVGMYFDQTAIDKMREWEKLYSDQNLGPEMVIGRDFEIRNGRLFFYRPWNVNELYLRDWEPQQTHNLTLSGSNAKTGYTLGLGYLDQKGALKVNEDKFQRYNVNLSVTSSVTNWLDARAKVLLSRATTTRPYYFSSETYDPWYYLYRWPRTYPYGTYEGKPFRSSITEVEQAKMNDNINTWGRMSIGGTFKIIPGLTVDADYTYEATNAHEQRTGGSVTAYNFWAGGADLNYSKYTSSTFDRAILLSNWNDRNVVKAYATYLKSIADHHLKFIAGTDVEVYKYASQSSERRTLLDPNLGVPNLAVGDQFVGSSKGSWSTLGYFGRINYDYQNKYLLELNGRYDGSSKFPLRDQWAFFPSVSAGYVISNESFMDFTKPVLSSLKFRGSWGSIGNQNVGDFRFLRTMTALYSNWLIGSVNQTTVSTPGLVSPSLTWESVTTLDFGADARFLNNQLGASFDWYKRTTSDMITGGITVPSTLGTSTPAMNYGEIQTTGWELTLDWNHKFGNGPSIDITGVLSNFKEEITKFSNTTKLLSGNFEGKTLGDIWGYETDRFFTADDFEKDANGNLIIQNGKYAKKQGIADQSKWESGWFFYGPGDIKYRDLNGDGKVDYGANTLDDHGDLRVIGNSTPRYQYGFRIGTNWKGFDLNFYIQGVGSRQLWVNGPIAIPGYRPGEAWYKHQLDYWTPENPDAFYPRPTDAGGSNNTRNFLPQTKYLLNMAYTRLKNINVGYTIPSKYTKKAKLSSARIYFSGENLFTIDHLNGLPIDPEVDYTPAGLDDSNTFGRVYPYRKSFSFGVQLSL